MPTALYQGPDPMFVREILEPFEDDPDWSSPSEPEPEDKVWATAQFLRGRVTPLTKIAIFFAFTDEDGAQVLGGTCTFETFVFLPRGAFSLPLGDGDTGAGRRMYFKTGENATSEGSPVPHPMGVPIVVDVAKHEKMGVRLSSIAAPAGATRLAIAIQELQ